ncbi:MAG: 6-carboxytetrahydropterin synthase [Fimbriimonadaceae bacterium]|nr:6-carboxytetrahydropterin synthase [Fimbriimonadaceae bacterium]QYK59350.1 MAG: 6-carboxytetrahydropterin synthase [Fimbriimonadaceae bacterium]
MVTINKEFRWEMGHRLPGHPLCQNVHGHSYRLVVEVTGEPDESGMVVDFGDLAALVKPLLDQLDHCFMLDPDDAVMRDLLEANGFKTTCVPFRSTAENIAVWFLERLGPSLQDRPNVCGASVTVHETATSAATVSWARPSPS